MLLDQVTEYELVTEPPELALTLLRAVGQISRDHHRYREEPAGPQTPTPGAQCLGTQVAGLAVYPHPGAWHEDEVLTFMECFRHDLLAAPAPATGGRSPGLERAGLSVDGAGVVLSSLRRRGDWLELRLACQHPPTTATIGGGLVAARAADLLGRPGPDLPVAGGASGSTCAPGRSAPSSSGSTRMDHDAAGGTGFPLPGTGRATVAVPAPGPGEGRWPGRRARRSTPTAGSSSPTGCGWSTGGGRPLSRSADGEALTTVASLDKERFGAVSMERPAVVRTPEGRWRLYVCCATPDSRHWWIDVLEAAGPEGLADAEATTVFAGDDRVGVKDPVIRVAAGRWHAWVCPPAGRGGRGGPHDHRLRDQPGRAGLGVARHRPGGTAGDLGRPRGPGHRRAR